MLFFSILLQLTLLSQIMSFPTNFFFNKLMVKGPTTFRLRLTKDEINSMKAGVIKQLLIEKKINTRGYFEKADLARLLFESTNNVNKKAESAILEVPIYKVFFKDNRASSTANSAGEDESKSFIGIDIFIKGKPYRCLVDTGASMNLMKMKVIVEAQLTAALTVNDQKTVGLLGSGSISTQICYIDKVMLSDNQEKSTIRGVQVAVLDDNQLVLPQSSMGLLGLTFLEKLPHSIFEFDFKAKVMRFGMTPADLNENKDYVRIPMRRIFTGLITCNVIFNGLGEGGGGESIGTFNRVVCQSMLDLGSTYTILNAAAVSSLTNGLTTLADLPESSIRVAGIDGKPLTLRKFIIKGGFTFGDGVHKITTSKSVSVYAADIPGLSSVGLGPQSPCCILGMDLLAGRNRESKIAFDLANNLIYLPKALEV